MSQSKLWPSSAGETHGRNDRALPEVAYSLNAELTAAMIELNRTLETAHSEALQPLMAPAAAMVREQVAPVQSITEASSYRKPVEPTPVSAQNFPEQTYSEGASVTSITEASSYQLPSEEQPQTDATIDLYTPVSLVDIRKNIANLMTDEPEPPEILRETA